jgi:hypothetical protein
MLDIFQSERPANLARGSNPHGSGHEPVIGRLSTVAAEFGADAERNLRLGPEGTGKGN